MTTTTTTMVVVADFYLPDECWEGVFRFLINEDSDDYNRHLNYLSFVSKQFLSITNRLRLHFSLTICHPTRPFLFRLFQRFPNLTSLDLPPSKGDGFCWISSLASSIRMKFTQTNSVHNSNSFAVSPRLKSLYLANNSCLRDESIEMFASIFPNLRLLDLSFSYNISEEGICQVLKRCSEIRHLNLTGCLAVKLRGMNFEIPNLEVLNLSSTRVDDEALYAISKSCRGLSQLLLEYCYDVTVKGVRHVVENCTQLTEINLKGCPKVSPLDEWYFKAIISKDNCSTLF
jgi:hypothetical protein